MTEQRHDRIYSLKNLNSYPSGDWLDTIIYLVLSAETRRRVWLLTESGAPTIQILDTTITPQHIADGTPRWVDYGVADLPFLNGTTWSGGDFVQLGLKGMRAQECEAAHLLVTPRLDFDCTGRTLDQVEQELWGLTRRGAGSTTIEPSQVITGTPTDFRVQYLADAAGLPAQARVRFAVAKSLARPQQEDPQAPGYVHVMAGQERVEIERIENSVESHEQYDIICRVQQALEPGSGFALAYSTDHTFLYPRRFSAADRVFWYTLLPPLAAAAAISEDAPFVSPLQEHSHIVEFVPGPASRLHLFLPGRRFASESIVLRGTFTDRYRNTPPTGPLPADIELWLVQGEAKTLLGSPADHFVARHRFEFPLPPLPPGVCRVTANERGTNTEIARSNPLELIHATDGRQRLYWGEIHGHTEMSDGSGEFSELYRHAKEEGALEFAAAADHSENFSDNQWRWMQDVTNHWNAPGRFVTLVAFEWGGRQMHRNVYTAHNHLDLFRGRHLPTSQLEEVWEHFHGDPQTVGGPHGSLAHGLRWEQHDPDVERFIEVYSMWGANDDRENPLTSEASRQNPRGMSVNEILQTGAHLGFTGGGDCHEGHVGFSCEDPARQGTVPHTFAELLKYRCGMTAALCEQLDRQALITALRDRQTYATTGARILLEFHVNDLKMGTIGTGDTVECRFAVHGVQTLRELKIIKDGKVAWHETVDTLDAVRTWHDPEPVRAEHYYYLQVVQQDGEMAWSSPVWVNPP